MGDPLGSPRVAPLIVVFSFLAALIFLVQFIMDVGWDLTRTGKEHPNQAFLPCSLKITKMPVRPNPGPKNKNRCLLLEQHTDETPCWHGAMEVVGLPSVTHA